MKGKYGTVGEMPGGVERDCGQGLIVLDEVIWSLVVKFDELFDDLSGVTFIIEVGDNVL